MPIYEYYCPGCKQPIEINKPMELAGIAEYCSECGCTLQRMYAPIPFSFGWRLTEKSHERFAKDEYEKDV